MVLLFVQDIVIFLEVFKKSGHFRSDIPVRTGSHLFTLVFFSEPEASRVASIHEIWPFSSEAALGAPVALWLTRWDLSS